MRRFLVLLRKELRELITPQILLPLVVVIVLFFALGQTLSSVGEDQQGPYPVVVTDADGGAYSSVVISALEAAGFVPVPADRPDSPEAIEDLLAEHDANVLVEIPAGFSAGIEAGEPRELGTWSALSNFSFLANVDIQALSGAMEAVNSAVAAKVAGEAAPSTPVQVLQRPVLVKDRVLVAGREAVTPVGTVMGFVSQQTTFIPIVLFVVIVFAAQMIATAIATEKENKTLETLLSYPVSRAGIVTSKMVAAGLIALASAGAYMLGMQQYMNGIEEGLGSAAQGPGAAAALASEEAMRQLGLTFGALDYVLLGLTLFAGILVALSIAIILGAFAESVKSVQSLLTPLMVLLLIPYFLTLFLDLSALPAAARIAVMAIPFTYPFITGPSLFLGDYATVWFGIGYQLVWFGVFVAIAARVFSSDRVLTMKLALKRKR